MILYRPEEYADLVIKACDDKAFQKFEAKGRPDHLEPFSGMQKYRDLITAQFVQAIAAAREQGLKAQIVPDEELKQ